MDAKDVFEAKSSNVSDMLREPNLGLYIPPYQRPYRWKKEHVNKLISDILHGLNELMVENNDTFTFLGTIITIRDDKKLTIEPSVKAETPREVLNIIDGQQRLTTLMILAVALHNATLAGYHKLPKSIRDDSKFSWLKSRTTEITAELQNVFYEKKHFGNERDNYYPRMIRAFEDQWSVDPQQHLYRSPIANFIKRYIDELPYDADEKVKDFNIAARHEYHELGEKELINSYNIIKRFIKDFARNIKKDQSDITEMFPSIDEFCTSENLQQILFDHLFPSEVKEHIAGISEEKRNDDSVSSLIKLFILGKYVLYRVAITDVRGKDENYAFTIFESLNTTGEPLTAFETFSPNVASAEGLKTYKNSKSYKLIEQISKCLAEYDNSENATRDALISFALAETGFKLTKRLQEQRNYLKNKFADHISDSTSRESFVRHMRDVVYFHRWMWENDLESSNSPLNYKLSDVTKLCLKLLSSGNHTIAIGLLSRYFSIAFQMQENGNTNKQAWDELETAIQATTAFFFLWRTSRKDTGNIDFQYRQIMSGPNKVLNFGACRAASIAPPTVAELKKELLARLKEDGEISDKNDWVVKARRHTQYDRIPRAFIKFLLLAAYHESSIDINNPGLVVGAKKGVFKIFTSDGWDDLGWQSIEHIAPQTKSLGWDQDIYNHDIIHCIGNLVALPPEANSLLNNNSWASKKAMYGALSAETTEAAKEIITTSGLKKTNKLEEITCSFHNPQLASLSMVDEWGVSIIEQRAECLFSRAWDKIFSMLNY